MKIGGGPGFVFLSSTCWLAFRAGVAVPTGKFQKQSGSAPFPNGVNGTTTSNATDDFSLCCP